jgi:deoxyribodipyrimidine photolyase-like uncharacterized protein
MNDSTYQIEVSDTKKVKKIFKDIEIIDEYKFTIKTTKEELNDILSKLIENNINVYGLYQKHISLEIKKIKHALQKLDDMFEKLYTQYQRGFTTPDS